MTKEKIKLIVEIILFICILVAITFLYYFGNKTLETEESSGVNLVKITDENFEEEVLDSEKPVILEFSSNSCPPCVTMVSTMVHIAKNNEDIKVASVNSDDSNTADLLDTYAIEAFPTILIFKDGEVVEEFVGVTSEETLLAAVQ